MSAGRVVLGTVPSDAHTWNLVYLELLLRENGFAVDCLGPCTSVDRLVAATASVGVDAVVLSTVNGHGGTDGAEQVRTLRRHRPTVPVGIGGKLDTDEAHFPSARSRLLAAGCDRVFTPHESPAALVDWLTALPAHCPGRLLPVPA